MPKLFAVLLGGRAEGCNTELHDVVFAVGDSLRATYPQLIKKWFGSHKRLHIDSSIELTYVDGHEISISEDKSDNNGKSLFFVNFGGYKKDYFGEVHEVNFYIAATKTEALARAKQELATTLLEQHCDDNLIVEDIIAVNQIDHYYLHIKPTVQPTPLQIESVYRKLDTAEILQEANALTLTA